MNRHLTLRNRHTGEVLRMNRVCDAQGQIVLNLEGSLPPHSEGPPLHVHFYEREEGKVTAGTLGAIIGGREIRVPAGGTAALPAGVPHRWWNAGGDLLEFSGQVIPAVDLDPYLQAMFAVLNAGPKGRPSIFYLVHVMWRHRHTQLAAAPPRAVQLFLFPIILMIGHILGKYRGANWPGSPQSCPGAPLLDGLKHPQASAAADSGHPHPETHTPAPAPRPPALARYAASLPGPPPVTPPPAR